MNDLPGRDLYDHELEWELARRPELARLDRPTVFDGKHLVKLDDASKVHLPDGRRFAFFRFRHFWGAWKGETLDVAALEGSHKLLSICLALGLGWPPEDLSELSLEVPPGSRLQIAETEAVDGLGSVVRWLEPPDAQDLIHFGTQAVRGLRSSPPPSP